MSPGTRRRPAGSTRSGKISGRTHHFAGARHLRFVRFVPDDAAPTPGRRWPWRAQIRDGASVRVHEDVWGLRVPMHDSARMGCRNGGGDAGGVASEPPPGAAVRHGSDPQGYALPPTPWRGDVSIGLAHFMDDHRVGMTEGRGGGASRRKQKPVASGTQRSQAETP